MFHSSKSHVMRAATLILSAGFCSQSFAGVGADFNKDGYDDLVIGVPYEGVGTTPVAGAFHAIYGASGGLKKDDSQFIHQDKSGVPNAVGNTDLFATSLAYGDFNDDGYDDLAIGIPGETVAGLYGAGAVYIMYGGHAGLKTSSDQFWHLNSPNVEGTPEQDGNFGRALIAGDFNDDGYEDLAIGVPGATVSGDNDAGMVVVLNGSDDGLIAAGMKLLDQAPVLVPDSADPDDAFGSALACGDFDDDGYCDLIIGVPGENVGGDAEAGAVSVFYGHSSGLRAVGSQFFSQDTTDIGGTAEPEDGFGSAVACGDFNVDGYCDIAVGVPYEAIGAIDDAGAVNVILGGALGLTTTGNQIWEQSIAGVPGDPDAGATMGRALIVGDFNKDGHRDLAIGIPGAPVNGFDAAGAVLVLKGDPTNGLGNPQLITQDSSNVSTSAAAGEYFGYALAVGDFDGNNKHDLVIGAPAELVNGVPFAGAVHVLYQHNGLGSDKGQFWHQNRPGIANSAEFYDLFGYSLGR